MKFNAKAFDAWTTIRKMGRLKYVIVTGVLKWGLPIGIGFALADYFINKTILGLTIKLPIWLAGGVLFGLFMWSINERAYRAYIAEHHKIEPQ